MKSILSLIKKACLLLINAGLLGMVTRLVIIFNLVFFIGPKYTSRLDDIIVKIYLLFLVILVVELLIIKASKVNSNRIKSEDKIDLDKELVSYKLINLLKKKTCFLFIYTPNVSIDNLLKNENYSVLDCSTIKDTSIKVYDNFYNVIVGCEISEFAKLLQGNSSLKLQILQGIKKSLCPSINIVVSIEDLIGLEEKKKQFLNDYYTCVHFLNSILKKRYNVNILVDQLIHIKGFYKFFNSDKLENNQRFGFAFLADIMNADITLNKFEQKLKALLKELNKMLLQSKIEEVKSYQEAFMFVGQLKTLSIFIRNLIESCVIPHKKSMFLRAKEVFFTVNFININEQCKIISPLIKEEFQNCFEIVEMKK